MKRLGRRLGAPVALLLALFASGLAAAADAPRLTARVTDQTGTLTPEQVATLEQRAASVEQRKGAQLVVLIVPTTAPDAIEQYSLAVAERNKIGRKGTSDGVLLLVAKDDRKARVEVGYGLEGAIPDITASRIIREYLAPHFRKNDFYGGLDEATQALAKLIEGEPLPPPLDNARERGQGGALPGALVFGLMLAFMLRALLGWLPMPVRPLTMLVAGLAGAYAISGSLAHGVAGGVLSGLFGLPGRGFGGGRGGGFGGGFPIVIGSPRGR